MIEHPHKHEFDQYLCFFGTNEQDLKDFGAHIEISLGEEGEKHIVDSPTVVHVAAGLIHGPVVWVSVDRPILFVDVAATNKYDRASMAK
jgi:hypothetical protein